MLMEGMGLFINVVVAIALGFYAKKYDKSPILWGLLGLVFGLMAIGFFLIKIGKKLVGWIIVIITLILNIIYILAILAIVFMVGFS